MSIDLSAFDNCKLPLQALREILIQLSRSYDVQTSTGSGGNYEVSLDPAPTAYFDGMKVVFKANHTNSGSATIDVDSLGQIPIKDFANRNLTAGAIQTNQVVELLYFNGDFILMLPSSRVASSANTGAAASTTSGTYATLLSTSVSLTVGVGEALCFIATTSLSISDGQASIGGFRVTENGSQIGGQSQCRSGANGTNGDVRSVTLCGHLPTPTVGTNTYALEFARLAGSGTIYARYPQLLVFTLRA